MAAKAFEPTQQQRDGVCVMKAGGMSEEQIAGVLKIDNKTLTKYFSEELANGKANIDARVMGTLANLATSGQCPAATFFYLKTRCGWKETHNFQHSGPDGTAIDINVNARDEFTSRIAGVAARIRALEANREPD